MWLPTDNPKTMDYSNLKRSHLPEFGYLRVLNLDNEGIIFIKGDLIVGSWCMDVDSLEEFYENNAMKLIKIVSKSNLEVYKTDESLFDTLMELNEECKLSLPIEIDLILNENVSDFSSRESLLSKYRIRVPSEDDVESLLVGYKD
ncbi:DUF2226 domain-containing protein [Methanobacterium alcaliphilum]|uniref:DUF2226 domain-containing protein n=1 Tax=Methanobacterium alcaliphilum TaxID=392018 RepID=UPI002009ED71|nr:DUF2226 domain-containing protein [Methanobacterium alcaliphilum]MCK9152157.1 hypothetical protein [Methanobacterium alcaliphilum]